VPVLLLLPRTRTNGVAAGGAGTANGPADEAAWLLSNAGYREALAIDLWRVMSLCSSVLEDAFFHGDEFL